MFIISLASIMPSTFLCKNGRQNMVLYNKRQAGGNLISGKIVINIVFKGYGLKRAGVFTSALFFYTINKICNKNRG
jgi:hypothetical protein